jgi:tetratricopeptide (TPR) repeat protein
MGAAAGVWQTGPGGLALNLIASALWKGGVGGIAKMFAEPTVDQMVEKLLLHNGLMVPPRSVTRWFAKPETLALLGRIEQRVFSPIPVARVNPIDAKALDEAAFSFRVHVGHRSSWTDGQGIQALQLVFTTVLKSDAGVQHQLSQLRAEHKIDIGFAQALDDLAEMATELYRIGGTADEILHGVKELLSERQLNEIVIPASNLPAVNSGRFVDRDGLLNRLEQAAGSTVALTAVYGMGGVGKSTVAKMYAHRCSDRFDFVRWINAAAPDGHDIHQTPRTMLDDLAVLGEELGVIDKDVDDTRSRARKAVTALNTDRWRWLLIYDNAEHPDAVVNWYPTPRPGSQVVFTTRSTVFDEIAVELAVDTFTPDTGAQYLRDRVTSRNPAAGLPDQRAAARDLAVYLGGLPLALEQAGAYVARRPTERFATLLARLRRDLPKALPRPPAGYPEPAHRTYLNSITAAQQEHPLTGAVLLVLSYADPDTGFPAELLHDIGLGASEEIDDAIAVLAELSLIAPDDTGLHVHRLVQQAGQFGATPQERVDAHTKLIAALLTVFTHAREPAVSPACRRLLPHIHHTTKSDDASHRQRWLLANWAAIALAYCGDPIAAVSQYETAVTLIAPLGNQNPDALTARNNLANSYRSAGRYVDAITLFEELILDYVEALGDKHPSTLMARANLAVSYESAGRNADAITLMEQVLADRVEILGDTHPSTLKARANLAESYRSAGRNVHAITLLEKVVADRVEILGDKHPSTLKARANLAESYRSTDRTFDAITLMEQVLADRVEILGEKHPDTLIARANLALSYQAADRTLDAITLMEQVLAGRVEILGDTHPSTLKARANLAECYRAAGRNVDAITLLEKVVVDRVEILGDKHPSTLKARANLALSYQAADRTLDAITLTEQVLADRVQILGDKHPDTLKARANLAESYRSAGRNVDAITLLENVVADRVEILGDKHSSTLKACANLAESYRSAGRYVDACTLLEHAIDLATQLDYAHSDLASWHQTLAAWSEGELPIRADLGSNTAPFR